MVEYTLDDIKGRHVIDNGGTDLGEVQDISVDPDTWEVRSFLVGVRREIADDLHLERPGLGGSARLSISKERVQSFGENVLLNVNRDDIARIIREEEDRERRR
jgi:sporulation protein YlmC with PRC-barrel domain